MNVMDFVIAVTAAILLMEISKTQRKCKCFESFQSATAAEDNHPVSGLRVQ